jgi:hypothetical protein
MTTRFYSRGSVLVATEYRNHVQSISIKNRAIALQISQLGLILKSINSMDSVELLRIYLQEII